MPGVPAVALPRGGTLTLDLSSIVGWAYGRVGIDRIPWFGTWHLPKIGGEGARYGSFENELAAHMDRLEPSEMVLETTLSLGAFYERSTLQIVYQQVSLRAVAVIEAWRGSCAKSEVDIRIARQEVLGAPWHLKREAAKRQSVQWCRERGMMVPDDNAADAVVIWEWHRMRLTNTPPIAGPLFREAM